VGEGQGVFLKRRPARLDVSLQSWDHHVDAPRSLHPELLAFQAAQGLSTDMENVLAGHREVERILDERRATGVFRLVTD
jgi:hypothetical protein